MAEQEVILNEEVVANEEKITKNQERTFFCVKCKNLLKEPFMECGNFHKYCMDCAKTLRDNRCDVTEPTLCRTKIYKYEKIDEDKIPCYNYIFNCPFTGTVEACDNHGPTCRYLGLHICPFSTNEKICKWGLWGEGINRLHRHFVKYHGESLKIVGRTDGPIPEVLRNLRDCFEEPANPEPGNYRIAIQFEQENTLFLKFSVTPFIRLNCVVEHLANADDQERRGYRYQITFGKTSRGVGNRCGISSSILYGDIIDLCDEDGNLHYEFNIIGREP